jgi:hypothetical protein
MCQDAEDYFLSLGYETPRGGQPHFMLSSLAAVLPSHAIEALSHLKISAPPPGSSPPYRLTSIFPRAENPADFFMTILQRKRDDFEDGEAGEAEGGAKVLPSGDLVTCWREKGAEYEKPSAGAAPASSLPDIKALDADRTVPRWYQTWVLFKRCALDSVSGRVWCIGRLPSHTVPSARDRPLWCQSERARQRRSRNPSHGSF